MISICTLSQWLLTHLYMKNIYIYSVCPGKIMISEYYCRPPFRLHMFSDLRQVCGFLQIFKRVWDDHQKVCVCNSYILNEYSSKLCILDYYQMKIDIFLLDHFWKCFRPFLLSLYAQILLCFKWALQKCTRYLSQKEESRLFFV